MGTIAITLASVVCKLFTFQASQSEHIIGPGSHVKYPTGTKNRNYVEAHPRNIPAKFGSNWPLEGPLQSLGFLRRSEIQDGRHCRK
jgi:hypothetical protein